MKNNIDINEIWKNQEMIEPNLAELMKSINSFKSKNLKNIVFINVVLILTSIFVVFIWIYFQPKLITTKIGLITTIIAMLLYGIATNKTIIVPNEEFTLDNNQFLIQLIDLKNKQKFLQNTVLKVYFVTLSIGICLYLIEYVLLMNIIVGITTYSATILWIVINWFYLRPKIIKKQNLKINELIRAFEKINSQLISI